MLTIGALQAGAGIFLSWFLFLVLMLNMYWVSLVSAEGSAAASSVYRVGGVGHGLSLLLCLVLTCPWRGWRRSPSSKRLLGSYTHKPGKSSEGFISGIHVSSDLQAV